MCLELSHDFTKVQMKPCVGTDRQIWYWQRRTPDSQLRRSSKLAQRWSSVHHIHPRLCRSPFCVVARCSIPYFNQLLTVLLHLGIARNSFWSWKGACPPSPLGGGVHSWAVSLPDTILGRRIKEIWRNFFVKNVKFWPSSGLLSTLPPGCAYVITGCVLYNTQKSWKFPKSSEILKPCWKYWNVVNPSVNIFKWTDVFIIVYVAAVAGE